MEVPKTKWRVFYIDKTMKSETRVEGIDAE
jgi:hypothetical protein